MSKRRTPMPNPLSKPTLLANLQQASGNPKAPRPAARPKGKPLPKGKPGKSWPGQSW